MCEEQTLRASAQVGGARASEGVNKTENGGRGPGLYFAFRGVPPSSFPLRNVKSGTVVCVSQRRLGEHSFSDALEVSGDVEQRALRRAPRRLRRLQQHATRQRAHTRTHAPGSEQTFSSTSDAFTREPKGGCDSLGTRVDVPEGRYDGVGGAHGAMFQTNAEFETESLSHTKRGALNLNLGLQFCVNSFGGFA